MLSIVFVLSLILGSISPGENSMTLHLSLIERPSVLSVGESESSLTLKEVMFEIAFVLYPVCELINPFAMFGPIQELSFIVWTVFPVLLSLSIGEIAQPLPGVCVFLVVINKGSIAFCNVLPDLAFIITAFGEYESSLPVSEPVGEGPHVVTAIFEEEFAETMRLFIFPFSSVDDSWSLNQMGRTRFPYAFSTASGFELIEFFHFVFDVLTDLGV